MSTESENAYLAGFLDGDGSIYVRLKRNDTYRFCFQVSPWVVFYQSKKKRSFLAALQRKRGIGYIRDRKDGIAEWIVGDTKSIHAILEDLIPFLQLKKKQAKLILKILSKKKVVKNAQNFLDLAKLIDQFKKLNYSKGRKVDAHEVRRVLQKKKLLAP